MPERKNPATPHGSVRNNPASDLEHLRAFALMFGEGSVMAHADAKVPLPELVEEAVALCNLDIRPLPLAPVETVLHGLPQPRFVIGLLHDAQDLLNGLSVSRPVVVRDEQNLRGVRLGTFILTDEHERQYSPAVLHGLSRSLCAILSASTHLWGGWIVRNHRLAYLLVAR